MVATAVTAAAAASKRRGREARARVLRTALITVSERYRGAGRGIRRPIRFSAVESGGDAATDFLGTFARVVLGG